MKKIITVALLGATLLSTTAHASVYDRSWIRTNKQVCKHGGLYPRFYFDKDGNVSNIREDYYDTRWGGPGTCEKALNKQLDHLLDKASAMHKMSWLSKVSVGKEDKRKYKRIEEAVESNYERIMSYLNSSKNTKHNLSMDMWKKGSYGLDYKMQQLDRKLEGL